MSQPGIIAFLGSGETSNAGGQLFEELARRIIPPVAVRVLETPAGFELNASRVAGRVADFIQVRLQNYQPDVKLIPARRRGTPNSPDSPASLRNLPDAQMIFMGPGSPTYAVRQLASSLAWEYLQTLHRLGAAVVLASAATISFGKVALPVYEIYKVGEEPHWKPGLDFFKDYGLSLIFIPHWNNTDGGGEVDTSHCFIGKERFEALYRELPRGSTVIGLDEHTGLIMDLAAGRCQVIGRSQIHVIRQGQELAYQDGDFFELSALGNYVSLADPQAGIDPEIWQKVVEERRILLEANHRQEEAPPEVLELVEQRQQARIGKNWKQSDALRDQIATLGWKVMDTPEGPRLERA